MKKIVFTILTCAIPAALLAQQAKLLEITVPEEPVKAAEAAPAKQADTRAAEAPPEVKPAPAPAKENKPAEIKPAAATGKGTAGKQAAADYAARYLPVGPWSLVVLPKEKSALGGFTVLKRHQIAKGDTLWGLALKYYKDPFMWGRIYNANFSSVNNPDLIYPDGELVIPDITELLVPYRVPVVEVTEVEPGVYYEAPPAYSAERMERINEAAMQGEIAADMDRNMFSDEMPEDQREWLEGVRIIPDGWKEDGVVTARLKNDDPFLEEGISTEGTMLQISMNAAGTVRPGDYLGVYLRGGEARDRAGRRLGRQVQPAGLAEVYSVTGTVVKARLIDATTAVREGYIVKKK